MAMWAVVARLTYSSWANSAAVVIMTMMAWRLALTAVFGAIMQQVELSNNAIALLCDIGEFDQESASSEQKAELQNLIDGRYIEIDLRPSGKPDRYKLTAKAITFLGSRGAGLNEA